MVAVEAHDPVVAIEEIEFHHENHAIAALLNEIAQLLSDQNASEFRVRAYQNAARTVQTLPTSLRAIFELDGVHGLIDLPTIGQSIANLVSQYLRHGRMSLLDRLRGDNANEHCFTTLPGIGPELSRRIHDHLNVETLPELFSAVQQGQLEHVPGIGQKRIRAIRECLSERLRSPSRQQASSRQYSSIADSAMDREISVAEILGVDDEYRTLASDDKLPRISPSKFNPGGVAWLPILHTDREGRHYTALYSNTARAHELNTTKDWVVIYLDDSNLHGRWTVITSQFGKLQGYRIVRGREDECLEHYQLD